MAKTTKAINPFDFTDLSDLPDDLATKLEQRTSATLEAAREYADVVQKGADAGVEVLSINQIIAAATRMDMDPPSQQTVRNYLNAAVDQGWITKPGRQSYSAVPAAKGSKAEAIVSDDPITTADTDELADLNV